MSTTPLRRNFIVNLLSPMTRIGVALVTVPLYLHHIGDARYLAAADFNGDGVIDGQDLAILASNFGHSSF